MTGTGTKADPYVIGTAAELYSMGELGGEGIYFALGSDIDLNGTPYAEHFVPIPLNCSEFDGCGHGIINILNNAPTSDICLFQVCRSGETVVKGLFVCKAVLCGNVVNLFKPGSGVTCSVELYDCAFRADIKQNYIYTPGSGCIIHGSGVSLNAELCSFEISGTFNAPCVFFRDGRFERSRLVLDIDNLSSSNRSSSNDTSVLYNAVLVDSWLMGRIGYGGSDPSPNIHICDFRGSMSNSYMALDISAFDLFYLSSTINGECFYDADLAGDAEWRSVTSYSSMMHGLSTAQCRNGAYLASIGFLCREGQQNGV